MAPILIDRRHLLTVVVLFLLIVISCLTTGYVLGYYAATRSNLEVTSTSELQIPDPELPESSVTSEKVASPLEPGVDIDVDSPDLEMAVVTEELVTEELAKVSIEEISEVTIEEISEVSTDEQVATNDQVINNDDDDIQENDSANDGLFILDTADASDAKYSIQVGLYGNKRNADRKVAALLDEDLSAYISESVNSKDETLFNVRFGYFNDKSSVLTALKLYQKKYTGDGYIVRLRRR